MRRVVITGMGIISPVGSRLDSAWQNVRDGVSGIGPVEDFDASEFPTQIAGTVRDFNADDYLAPKDQRKNDPFIHYGVAASVDAIEDSGLEITEANGERIGVAMGSESAASSSSPTTTTSTWLAGNERSHHFSFRDRSST